MNYIGWATIQYTYVSSYKIRKETNMLQLLQIPETLDEVLGENTSSDNLSATNIIQQLSEQGVDLLYLSQLNPDQIMEVINNSGIDLGNFEPHQITEALQHFNAEGIDIQGAIENAEIGKILENFVK